MILIDVCQLIEEADIHRDIKHYKKLKDVPRKVIDNPKLAVKITKNVTKDLIKNSPNLATGIITGINPKGTIHAIKEIKKKKHKLLKHPLNTAYTLHGIVGGWDELAKTVADSTIKSTR